MFILYVSFSLLILVLIIVYLSVSLLHLLYLFVFLQVSKLNDFNAHTSRADGENSNSETITVTSVAWMNGGKLACILY